MPLEWLQVLAHKSTTDKANLLLKLKYEMTVADVQDLIEYQSYENWQSYEEYIKSKSNNQ
jgi:hypothetical protein